MPRPTIPRLIAVLGGAALVLAGAACAGGSSTAGQATTTTAATRVAAAATARPSSGCRSAAPAEAAGAHHLAVGTQTRTYQLAGPDSTSTGPSSPGRPSATGRSRRPAPLILLFHGFNGGGAEIADYTRLPALASADGYLVASPDGTAKTWQLDAHGTDAAFVTALLAHLESTRCVDEHRVYLAGFSAGAAFALIYGCQHEDQFAALATVAVEYQLGCTRPLPLLAFHGTLDPLVPFANGAKGASLPGVAVRGTELNMGDWARLDRCAPTSTDTVIGSQVTRQVWPGCADGTAVVLYRVEGGGHTWPGASTDDGGGLTTHQIDASRLMIDFFGDHPPTG